MQSPSGSSAGGGCVRVSWNAGPGSLMRVRAPEGLRSSDLILPGLEARAAGGARHGGNLANVSPSLLIVGNDELVDAGRDNVPLHAGRVREQHEGLLAPGGWRRIRHGLGRSVVVVDLNKIARRNAQLLHVVWVHLD